MAEKLVQLKQKGGGGGSQGLTRVTLVSNSTSGTVNVGTVFAQQGITYDYHNLTNDNFIAAIGTSIASIREGHGGYSAPSLSYNASTGVLTYSAGRTSGVSLSENIAFAYGIATVYCIF